MATQPTYNAQWAKENISMPELLACFGHEPVRITKNGSEYWYISPFRYEKEPSFHTSYLGGKWIWNDFGRGDVKGSGTVIGFMELYENTNVSGALKTLKALFSQSGTSIPKSTSEITIPFQNIKKEPDIAITETLKIQEIKSPIWDKRLIGYLAGERKINFKLARPYLKHIKYTNVRTGKTYDTIGFPNDSGDYECRDKYFKGILKHPEATDRNAIKNISYLPGRDKNKVAVFEGFMDFLTALTIKNVPVLPVDTIVLNMVNMRGCAIDFIRQADYKEVFTFFDNDVGGERTTEFFLEELRDKVRPMNYSYRAFEDYNNYIQKR